MHQFEPVAGSEINKRDSKGHWWSFSTRTNSEDTETQKKCLAFRTNAILCSKVVPGKDDSFDKNKIQMSILYFNSIFF